MGAGDLGIEYLGEISPSVSISRAGSVMRLTDASFDAVKNVFESFGFNVDRVNPSSSGVLDNIKLSLRNPDSDDFGSQISMSLDQFLFTSRHGVMAPELQQQLESLVSLGHRP